MGEYERRQVDGCATFFKTSKFKLLERHNLEFQQLAMQRPDLRRSEDVLNRVMIKDNIAVITFLENVVTGARILVANAHLHWDPAYCDVKLIQTALLLEEVDRLLSVWLKVHPQSNGSPTDGDSAGTRSATPVLFCGDFNSLPDSAVFEFLSKGHISADHEDIRDFNYSPFSDGGITHKYGIKSAYSHIDTMPFTNFTPTFQGIIDYIWYSTQHLSVTGLLSHVDKDYVAKSVGFPNAHHPSDHIPLVVSMRTKQNSTPNGPRKIVFK